MAQIPDFFIEDTCTYVRDAGLLNDIATRKVVEFLKYRRDNISQIINNHRNEFKGIDQPGLPNFKA